MHLLNETGERHCRLRLVWLIESRPNSPIVKGIVGCGIWAERIRSRFWQILCISYSKSEILPNHSFLQSISILTVRISQYNPLKNKSRFSSNYLKLFNLLQLFLLLSSTPSPFIFVFLLY